MANAVTNLTAWFDNLSTSDQREVYKHLYGDTIPMTDAYNLGPNPMLKAVNLGATPMNVSTSGICPTCGKRL